LQITSPWTTEQFWREPPASDNGEYHSLAFPALVERFDEGRKYQILDLGPAYGRNVEFFSQFSCKLYVADLYRTLRSYPSVPTDEEDSRLSLVFGELLPYPEDTRFDLVLTWDLLNYLESEQIEALGRRLASFSKAGTMVLAMIAIHPEMPARPCGFKILDAGTFEYDSVTNRTRPAPRHKEPDLCRLLPGFEVENTFVLRNGLQEYVFAYNPYAAGSSGLASEG
jgi:hypothetical protein